MPRKNPYMTVAHRTLPLSGKAAKLATLMARHVKYPVFATAIKIVKLPSENVGNDHSKTRLYTLTPGMPADRRWLFSRP